VLCGCDLGCFGDKKNGSVPLLSSLLLLLLVLPPPIAPAAAAPAAVVVEGKLKCHSFSLFNLLMVCSSAFVFA
jgi:hypothetical protein